MRELSVSAAWDEAKVILMREGRLLVSVALALIVLPQVLLAVAGVPVGTDATMLSRVIYIGAMLLGIAALVALCRLAIGPSVRVADAISQGFVRLLSVFAVLFFISLVLAVAAALIAMVLSSTNLVSVPRPGQPPSVWLILLLITLAALTLAIVQLTFPIAAVETGNPIRIVSRSWRLSRGNYWRLLGFSVMIFVGFFLVGLAIQVGLGSALVLLVGKPVPGSLSALILGLIAGVVQAGFSVVIAVMLARIYLQLSGDSDAAATPWH